MVWVAGMEWGELAKVQDFSLEGLSAGTVHNIEFVLSSASLGGADGLLGENVLGVSDVEYDLANGIVRIFHPMNCGKQDPLAYWHGNSDVSVLETDIRTPRQPHIKSTARLDGVELRVLFDTGAPRSLLTRRAAIKAGYKPLGAGVTSQGFGAAGFTSARTWIGSFKMLELGGEVIKNVRLEVGEVQDRDPDFDLMLGADFFLAHRVYVAKSQRRMYFTYNGGPVFDLRSHDSAKVASANLAEPLPVPTGSPTPAAPPAPAGSGAPAARATPVTPVEAGSLPEGSDVPTDAAGFRLRAAASAARGDLASAYRDFDRAIELAPSDADTFYQRAVLHQASHETQLALTDLDQAIRLRPADVQALMLRGQLRLATSTRDPVGASSDFDAAISAAPEDAYLALQVAALLGNHDLRGEALAHYDRWVAANPNNPRMAGVPNNRCWLRATDGKQLDLALKDCDEALHRRVTPAYLNSRGLVYLRMGQLNKAIADYHHALNLNARDASSLYGLGLAQQKKGLTREAERNLKAAVALRASIAQDYKSMGLDSGSSGPVR
jgi:tetratricopeptide (TPR) repeat protein